MIAVKVGCPHAVEYPKNKCAKRSSPNACECEQGDSSPRHTRIGRYKAESEGLVAGGARIRVSRDRPIGRTWAFGPGFLRSC
jgi:hypothetical protein